MLDPIFDHFYEHCSWQLEFAWLPHRCYVTGRLVWVEFAYKGTAMWTGPGDPVYEHRWHSRHEHIIWKLKYGW